MPTTRSRGLSTADLDTLRTAVEAGRKPKVQFTSAAGQVAGQIGQVVRFDDPSADEWVVVRFGRDELPFAPTDLQLAPKPAPRPKAVPKPLAAIATTTGEALPAAVLGVAAADGASPVAPAVPTSTVSAVPKAPAAPATVAAAASTATRPVTATAAPATVAKSPVSPAPGKRPGTTSAEDAGAAAKSAGAPGASAESAGAAKPAGTAAAAKNRPARKGAAKRAPDLTVTLAHHEGYWTVSAARGARMLVKPTSVRAADALKMVGQLESPAVAEAVEEIVSAARAEAEEQAERLRQQLAEVEAALADLSDPE